MFSSDIERQLKTRQKFAKKLRDWKNCWKVEKFTSKKPWIIIDYNKIPYFGFTLLLEKLFS